MITPRPPILCLMGLLLSAAPAWSEPARVSDEAKALLSAAEADPTQRKALLDRVKPQAGFCRSCHGEDGNAVKPEVPHLAGQNPAYVVEQLEKMGDGRRFHYLMQQIAENLDNRDRVGLALLFSEHSRKPSGGDPVLASRGKKPFAELCARCHGADGHGGPGYANIAGQSTMYIGKTLRGFRDRNGGRLHTPMEEVVSRLDDATIDALANYIATLP